jgi:hypothetical protein
MWCTTLQTRLQSGRILAVSRYNYDNLPFEGKRLIASWLTRSDRSFKRPGNNFEAFIFLWIAFNGWATCVTGGDRDIDVIEALAADPGIVNDFDCLFNKDAEFAKTVKELRDMMPIFDSKELYDNGLPDHRCFDSRDKQIDHYLNNGATKFRPLCGVEHTKIGQDIPADWPHLLMAIYKIRCNLFHGQKSAFSSLDRKLVNLAFTTLYRFVSQTGYLNH